MDLLARREHSRYELLTKLIQKGCSREIAEPVLDAMAKECLLSDERFVESLVETRCRQGHGPLRVRHDLRHKGVQDALIQRWLNEGDKRWIEIAGQVRKQKYGDALPNDYKERARQARFLQSRGFTAEQIRRVLKDDDLF